MWSLVESLTTGYGLACFMPVITAPQTSLGTHFQKIIYLHKDIITLLKNCITFLFKDVEVRCRNLIDTLLHSVIQDLA